MKEISRKKQRKEYDQLSEKRENHLIFSTTRKKTATKNAPNEEKKNEKKKKEKEGGQRSGRMEAIKRYRESEEKHRSGGNREQNPFAKERNN